MPGAVHEAHVAHELEAPGTSGPQAGEAVVLGRPARDEAGGPRTFRVVAFVDLCVRVTYTTTSKSDKLICIKLV